MTLLKKWRGRIDSSLLTRRDAHENAFLRRRAATMQFVAGPGPRASVLFMDPQDCVCVAATGERLDA